MFFQFLADLCKIIRKVIPTTRIKYVCLLALSSIFKTREITSCHNNNFFYCFWTFSKLLKTLKIKVENVTLLDEPAWPWLPPFSPELTWLVFLASSWPFLDPESRCGLRQIFVSKGESQQTILDTGSPLGLPSQKNA